MNADKFRGTVKDYMEQRHIRTREQLRAHTTIGSSTTFRKHWNDPDLMPMGNFFQIMNALNVQREKQLEIFY